MIHLSPFLESPGTALPTEQRKKKCDDKGLTRCAMWSRLGCTYPHGRNGTDWFIVAILEVQNFNAPR